MEVICNRKVLHRALQAVSRAVSGRSTLPILSNVLLKASDKGLSLLTTDLEIWMECLLPAAGGKQAGGGVEVGESGSITVPARMLGEVVGNLPEATVQLRGDEQGNLQLSCGASRYEIRGLPAEEYPAFPEVGKEIAFEVRQELLQSLIEKTVFAASTDETRAILTGALLSGEGKQLRMVATDSYRLSLKQIEIDGKGVKAVKVIVPARALRELARFLDHGQGEEKVEVRVGASQILFRLAESGDETPGVLSLVGRLVEGQFPNFEKVIPKEHERRITINREDFLATIKRCIILARTEAMKLIFEPKKEKMIVRAESADYGNVREEVPISLEGEEIQIAFNGEYLQQALEAMTGKTVGLDLGGPLSPGLLQPADDPDHTCIVMPMQIL
jgi:DNA polymerase III subunit beta